MQDLSSSLVTSWLQKCRTNRTVPFRPLYHKTGKHALRCEIILWQISFRVFIEPSTNQDWLNCLFLLIQTKKKIVVSVKSTNYSWIRCWTPPSSGRIGKRLGRRKQIWKSRLTKFQREMVKLASRWNIFFSSSSWRPNAPLGQKTPKPPTQDHTENWFSFRKRDKRGWKSTFSPLRLKVIS